MRTAWPPFGIFATHVTRLCAGKASAAATLSFLNLLRWAFNSWLRVCRSQSRVYGGRADADGSGAESRSRTSRVNAFTVSSTGWWPSAIVSTILWRAAFAGGPLSMRLRWRRSATRLPGDDCDGSGAESRSRTMTPFYRERFDEKNRDSDLRILVPRNGRAACQAQGCTALEKLGTPRGGHRSYRGRRPRRRSWSADIAEAIILRRPSRKDATPDAAPASRSATVRPRARGPRALGRRPLSNLNTERI
jgi:hypothetical protein